MLQCTMVQLALTTHPIDNPIETNRRSSHITNICHKKHRNGLLDLNDSQYRDSLSVSSNSQRVVTESKVEAQVKPEYTSNALNIDHKSIVISQCTEYVCLRRVDSVESPERSLPLKTCANQCSHILFFRHQIRRKIH